MKTPRFLVYVAVLATVLALGATTRLAAASSVAGGTAPGTAPAPASAAVNDTVGAAVAALAVIAEEGEQLNVLYATLCTNLARAREGLQIHRANAPASDAVAEVQLAWKTKSLQLEKAVLSAQLAVTKFDRDTWPAFQRRVDAAKHNLELAMARSRANAQEAKHAADAAASLDASYATIRDLQNPPPTKPRTPPAGSSSPVAPP